MIESSHLSVVTERDLDEFKFSAKNNYGPGTDMDMLEFFPKDWFVNKKLAEHFLEALTNLHDFLLDEYGDVFIADIDLVQREYDMTCTNTLCLFLIFMFKQVSIQFYKELCVVLVLLIYEFDTLGESIFLQDCDIQEGGYHLSDKEDANVIPEILNLFVIDGFKKCIDNKSIFVSPQVLEILRPTNANNNRILIVCKFLSEWLYHFNFTEYVVQYYTGNAIPGVMRS